MKDYKQFIKQLPSSTIVCALGEFNPPTVSHELLVKTVKVVAEQKQCDHVVFLSPSEILNEDKKKQFLKVLFPNNNFVSLGESFFSTVVKKLNETVVSILEEPAIRQKLLGLGADPILMNVQEFTKFVRGDYALWAPIVKASGAKPE